ncbi:MAG: hypothetical protein IJU41_01650, partial [Clostridia bacterium]|nr:hypothetical protein [Clostridia bacterium]
MKNSLWTKLLSMLLALIMMLGTLPVTALPALAAGVPETLVTSLTELYSGDETHAREDLEALYAAGLLDDDGKLVDLDIREDGEPVELDALAERIGNGETVGLISVNGTVVTPEQILKISQVKVAVEIAAMLDEEIDVTDEHVENLESLLNGIQNGEVDLDNAIRTGALRLSKTGASLRGTGTDESTAPVTYNHTDALTLSEDGTSYIAPYISGTTYIPNYHFELPDEAEGSTSFSESVDYVGSPVARMKTGFDTDVVHDVMPADSGVLSKYAISYTLPGSRSLDFPGGPWDFSYVVDWKWFSSFGNTGNMISSGQLSVSSQGLNVNWTPDIYAAGGS